MQVCETAISLNDVMEADELFVTNAIRGIKWVYHCVKKYILICSCKI
jgi:branched-subunit amino acid aminotransferase/4-amino-4-deoxychorismate lyase